MFRLPVPGWARKL